MKIKTITCHDVYNYGSSLQAYALMKCLEDFGHDVEIINYKPYYLTTRYNFWYIEGQSRYRDLCNKSKFIHLLYALKNYPVRYKTIGRKSPFDQFRNKYLKITDRRYATNEELKTNPPTADLFITGSDQVWNSVMLLGRDPAFFLDFVPEGFMRASYASSFGESSIVESYKSFTRVMLEKLSHISVRETTGLKILKTIDIKNAIQALDPVFLLSRQQWESIIKKEHTEKYLLVYDFIHDPAIEQAARKIAAEKGWKIYSINDERELSYAHKNISNAGPLEFMEFIKSSQMVISNSFHGTAFSIIFEKEFYVFNLATLNNSSRMSDLLSLVDLSHRHISSKEQMQLTERIDYSKVKQRLYVHRAHSYSYLDKVLKMNITTPNP